MSRLIEQLRESDFPDQSARDLTLQIGDWAEQNKREDIFSAHPDFAQEYHALRDDIQRARRPSYTEEFKGAFGSAVDEMQATGYAGLALAAHGLKAIGVPGAEPVRNNLLRLMKEQQDEAAQYQPSVGSYDKISAEHPLEDAARYGTYGMGTVLPSMLQAGISSLIGAGAGAALGTTVEPGGGTAVGAAGGALMGLAERKLAQKVLSRLLETGVKNYTLEQVAETIPRSAVIAEAKRMAVEYGSQAALAASSVGQEIGSIYADNPEAPGSAIAYGIPAGLLDVLPESYVLSRFFKPGVAVTEQAAKGAKGYLKRFAEEAFKTIPMEGSTEAAQTLLEIAAAKNARGESPTSFTHEDYQQALNAGIIGAIGGLGMAPLAAGPKPAVHGVDPAQQLTDHAFEKLPPTIGEADTTPAGPMDFGQGNDLPGLTDINTLPGGLRTDVDRAVQGDQQGFSPEESKPYELGAEPPPPVKLPKSVERATEAAERAAAAWEAGHQIEPGSAFGGEAVEPRSFQQAAEPTGPMLPEEAPPASGEITDAPLANLVGTTVEYQGYTGQLVRDPEGNFMVLPPSSGAGQPFWIEVADTGKDATKLASQVGINPLEPASMTPKPAPTVAVPSVAGRPPSDLSRVPLGTLFPSDLVPRQDITLPPMTPVLPRGPQPAQAAPAVTPAVPSRAAPQNPVTAPAVTGATNLVEKSPAVNPAPKGRRFQFATLPDGTRDLLNQIYDVGGIMAPGKGDTGGEYNDFAGTFSGAAKILVGKHGERGLRPDKLAQALGFEHVPDFYRAVENAKEQRRRAVAGYEKEISEAKATSREGAQQDRWRKAAVDREARPKSLIGAPKDPGEMSVGDSFRMRREPVRVVDIDPDTNEVIVEDGDRFGTQRLAPGESIYPDKRSYRRVSAADAVSFLSEEDAAPPTTIATQTGEAAPGTVEGPVQTAIPQTPNLRVTAATGEQAIARGGNGVKPVPQDSIPNVRRLRIFEQPKPAPTEEEGGIMPAAATAQPTVESQSLSENPLVALDRAVGKAGKHDSSVAVIVVDNATGQAFQRGAYRGAGNTLYVDMASKRKGTAIGQGSTVVAEADFLNGNEGRPAQKLFAERLPDGSQRYSIYGIGELTKPGGPRNWNMGPAAALNANPAVQEVARRYWTDEAKRRNVGKIKMPAATADLEAFPHDMAAWRRDNTGEKAAATMLNRIREYAAQQAKAYGSKLTEQQLASWVENLRSNIEQIARVEQKQSILLSDDYTVAQASTADLYRSTLKALIEGGTTDVVAFEQQVMGSLDRAAQTTGFVLTPEGRKKIVAFALSSLNGPLNSDTVLSVLHEAGHIVTDGLSEPLRVAFQEAIERMGWRSAPDGMGRWLMNPRSLDIRLLANSDPAQLSPEQRAALERLTPEEVAAARRMDRGALLEEQMAEHLAQLGWDRSEAKSLVQRFIRFVKELWLRLAMAVQSTMKGPRHISPTLARAYVENRFLQFIHRDSALARDRVNDLRNWLGVPATDRQLVPVFPAGRDWDSRMQYIDVASGQLLPVDHAIHTPPAQLAYLKASIDNAARWVRDNPPGGPDTSEIRMTRRAAFSAPLSFTPALQTNVVFAALNLEEEIYRQIAAHPEIGPLLGPSADFQSEWLKLPDKQLPAARRGDAEAWAKSIQDPTTGAPVAYDNTMTIDRLPAAAEPITDRQGKPITIQLTEAQDKSLQQTIAALGDAQARQQRRIAHEESTIASLERMRKRNPAEFPEAALKELSDLKESLPLRQKIAEQLATQKNALLSKFQPGDVVNVYPTSEYLTVPSPTATEAQIRGNKKGVVPRDLKFTDKTSFAGHLAAMEAWLLVPENHLKGQIYGIIAEQYRKLMQIPTDLQRAGTAAVFRRAITGSFADELRSSGLRSLQALAKKFFEVASLINAHGDDFKVAGDHWSESLANFAKAVGETPNQDFKERVWDPLMRIWNFIDVSERNKLGGAEEGDLFSTMERGIKVAAGIDIDSAAKRSALRALLMQTIESERQIRTVYEQNPGLKVRDEEMGVHRRLVSHGLVTGRRSVARHIAGLFMQMNPAWSDTLPLGPEDVRTFWEAVPDLYASDRKALDARVAELFPGYVVRDFVEPLVNNNTQIFDVQDADGVVRKASLVRVRQAWSEAGGDIVAFAQHLHALEGGKPGAEGQTVGSVMKGFRRMFEEIKADQDSKNATEASGHEILPRQMMDARIANDWPADWVSYATYTKADNLVLLHQLSRAVAFGRDAIAGSGDLRSTLRQAKLDLKDLYYRFDEMVRDGKSQRDIETQMGPDDYRIAKNANAISSNLDRVETAFRTMSSDTNYLAGDFKLLNEALGFASSMMVQNPRGTAINTADILGPLVSLKLSSQALKGVGRAIHTLAADLGNGVLQAFGQNAAFNIEAAQRRIKAGVKDPDLRTTWRTKMANLGPGLSLAAPSGYESPLAKTRRVLTGWAAKGRDIIPNLGSPLQGTGDLQTLSPKLRWGGFPNWAMSTMNANIDSAYEVFAELATRGVDRINQMPAAERAKFVRELELGVRSVEAEELGYNRGILLNDRAAFESLRYALQTKMAGENGVGQFIAKAYRRFEAAAGGEWEAIENSQFTDIVNYANTEWTLQNNFASLPPWMQSGPLRPLFIFLTWPYNAMRRFGKTFTDPEGRMIWWGANSTVADGMKSFFLLAAPATIAGSFAIDWYDKYLLGKKQNQRETSALTALPGAGLFVDPAAWVERVGRYGSAGLASDVLNQIINFDTQRNLSLDNRIVAINAISSLVNSLVTTPIHQHGNITYGSVARPFFQAVGGGGVLQYLQVVNNALGLNNQEAAINARINTGNYLRAAGRELNLPVRVSSGASEVPTRTTPYLQQMELAALIGNPDLFREAYQNALEQARIDHPDAPEKYVADNFAERHPLKRIFKASPTEGQYRKLLTTMDDYGAQQVRNAVNSYNGYLVRWFGKKAYFGKVDREGGSAEDLIRAANRINDKSSTRNESLLAIP